MKVRRGTSGVAAMIECPHPELCNVRRHRNDSGSRQACAARGRTARSAPSKAPAQAPALVPTLRRVTNPAHDESSAPGFLRHDEVTKEYNPELYRAIRRSPKHWFDKKTGLVSVFTQTDHLELPIGDLEDPDVQRWLTRGACGGLALSLHDRTGWDLVVLHGDGLHGADPKDPGARTWIHAMVRHPSGRLLDIQGLSTEDEIRSEWRGTATNLRLTTNDREGAVGVLGGDLDYYREHERALIGDYARLLVENADEEAPALTS